MTQKTILLLGNPALRKKSAEITTFDENLNNIVQDLKDTLSYLQNKKKIGRALAAPQIGYFNQIIYMNDKNRSITMVNPKITWKSDEMFEVWDSCFSFDVAFFVKIKRYKKINVEYWDESGNHKGEVFEGSLSELFQHEIDHLHGILATDHLKDSSDIIMRSEWEKQFKTDS